MSSACAELWRLFERRAPKPPLADSLLGVCPRCGYDGLRVDLRTGLPWCDRCFLAVLGIELA